MCLITACAFCQRRFLLRVDLQSVQTLPKFGEELMIWSERKLHSGLYYQTTRKDLSDMEGAMRKIPQWGAATLVILTLETEDWKYQTESYQSA